MLSFLGEEEEPKEREQKRARVCMSKQRSYQLKRRKESTHIPRQETTGAARRKQAVQYEFYRGRTFWAH